MNSIDLQKRINKPEIKRHANFFTFMKSYVDYQKSTMPGFNLDLWTAEMGFKSRSFMYMIYSGARRMTPKFVNSLSEYLNLSPTEKEHLQLLSYCHNATSVKQKKIYSDKILENMHMDEVLFNEHLTDKFLSSTTLPLIKLLLAFEDTNGTEEELCYLLKVKKNSLRKNLKTLESLGLIRRIQVEASQGYRWKATDKAFVIPRSSKTETLAQFHLNTFKESADAVLQKEIFKRFRSVFFALQPEAQPEFLEDIESFLAKMRNKYACNQLNGKKLIKLNVQAYDVSQELK